MLTLRCACGDPKCAREMGLYLNDGPPTVWFRTTPASPLRRIVLDLDAVNQLAGMLGQARNQLAGR